MASVSALGTRIVNRCVIASRRSFADGLSCIAGPGNPPEGPSAMLFPAKLLAPGAHALSSGKRTATAHKGRPIATFVICSRRLRFHFPGKAMCGAFRQGGDFAGHNYWQFTYG